MKSGRKNKKIRGFFDGSASGLFLAALKFLADSGARYVVVGGVAANLHGISRGTRDIDILLPKDLENTRKILAALENLTWGIAKEISAEEVVKKSFTIIGDAPRVDLLFIAGKLTFEDAYKNKILRTIGDIAIPFVSLSDLEKSKQTGRPNDSMILREIKRLKRK